MDLEFCSGRAGGQKRNKKEKKRKDKKFTPCFILLPPILRALFSNYMMKVEIKLLLDVLAALPLFIFRKKVMTIISRVRQQC